MPTDNTEMLQIVANGLGVFIHKFRPDAQSTRKSFKVMEGE